MGDFSGTSDRPCCGKIFASMVGVNLSEKTSLRSRPGTMAGAVQQHLLTRRADTSWKTAWQTIYSTSSAAHQSSCIDIVLLKPCHDASMHGLDIPAHSPHHTTRKTLLGSLFTWRACSRGLNLPTN